MKNYKYQRRMLVEEKQVGSTEIQLSKASLHYGWMGGFFKSSVQPNNLSVGSSSSPRS